MMSDLSDYSHIHSKITKNVWITGWEGSINANLLKTNNIKTIICINKELHKKEKDLKMYKALGIDHHYIMLDDMPDVPIDMHFDRIYDLMMKSVRKGGVLVHCTMGISRSVTAVISVILKRSINKHPNANIDTILEYVKKRRPCAQPNPGFYAQLKKYEHRLRNIDLNRS
jgi:protein-tyrosine phosphatase